MKKIKLFCFPYAGGSSSVIYNKWVHIPSNRFQVVPVELPGRGKRIAEPLKTNIQSAIQDIYSQIKDQIDDQPFAFFGHSMGSLLAYELYCFLQDEGAPLPKNLFLSGGAPPHIYKNEGRHLLSEGKFIKMVKKYGGLPEAFLHSKELLNLYIPILRADFEVVETYEFVKRENKLDCDITVLYGKDDQRIAEHISDWKEFTNANCHFHSFNGGHFYLLDHSDEILNIINATIDKQAIRE